MWHEITLQWARWLKQDLIDNNIEDILICGDLFHYRDEIAVNTISVVTDILDIWRDFNIVLLVGNHDAFYKDRSEINSLCILKGWSNITVIDEPKQLTFGGKKLMFCPWGTYMNQIQESDIIFGHFEITSFKLNQHKVCEDGIKSSQLLSKAPLVITGHFHLREEREYSDGNILYLGNPFQMDFGDVGGRKGWYNLDLVTGEYKFNENELSPTHQKVKLSDIVEHDGIDEALRDTFKNNIVKIIIDLQVAPDDMDILLKKFMSLNAMSITADYDVNFNKFGLTDDTEHDLSGVDISVAIEEFINMLDDVPNKESIIEYTIGLYNKNR